MKKILLGFALSVVVLQSCKKDDDEVVDETVVLTVEEQNAYDDAAAINYMDTHYFDSKGNVVAFSDAVTTDDAFPKLSSYSPVKLNSGVIYIKRTGAQPEPGTAVNPTDVINIMQNTKIYVSGKVDDKITFGSEGTFSNTVSGSGDLVPVKDPAYFYVKKSVMDKFNKDNATTFDRSFFEIEGLQEGLKYFNAFNLDDSADYNLQGVIIVPSRAAFARDTNYYNVVNRSFVFNFQLYKTKTRNLETEN